MAQRWQHDFGQIADAILDLIAENSYITINEMAESTAVSKRTIIRNINKLKSINLLQRIGPNLGGYWKIKNES
jgi:ATP-dependent DNA helicase RecG